MVIFRVGKMLIQSNEVSLWEVYATQSRSSVVRNYKFDGDGPLEEADVWPY